jgi:hypothetical protein
MRRGTGHLRNVVWTNVIAVVLLGGGCLRSNTVECADGRTCPADSVCADSLHACIAPADFEACDGKVAGDACGSDEVPNRACVEGACRPLSEHPLPRIDPCAGYDRARGRVVLSGGLNYTHSVEDTWDWNGTAWIPWSDSSTSAGLGGRCQSVYDPKRGQLLRLSENTMGGATLWSAETGVWTLIPESTPPAYGHIAYDPSREKVLLVPFGPGGRTWAWDGAVWQELATSFVDLPWGPIAFDPSIGRMVLYGVRFTSEPCTQSREIWELTGTGWTKQLSMQDAGYSCDVATTTGLTYDKDRGLMILFGGTGVLDVLLPVFELNSQTHQVRNITSAPCCNPEKRSAFSVTVDEGRGQVVLFGGTYAGFANDTTWLWSSEFGGTWTKVERQQSP